MEGEVIDPLPGPLVVVEMTCEKCHGKKKIEGQTCSLCLGTGRRHMKITLGEFKRLLDGAH